MRAKCDGAGLFCGNRGLSFIKVIIVCRGRVEHYCSAKCASDACRESDQLLADAEARGNVFIISGEGGLLKKHYKQEQSANDALERLEFDAGDF